MRRFLLASAIIVNALMIWVILVIPYQARQAAERAKLEDQRRSAQVCRDLWMNDLYSFKGLSAACSHLVIEDDLRAGKSIGDARRHAGEKCIPVLDSCMDGLVQ